MFSCYFSKTVFLNAGNQRICDSFNVLFIPGWAKGTYSGFSTWTYWYQNSIFERLDVLLAIRQFFVLLCDLLQSTLVQEKNFRKNNTFLDDSLKVHHKLHSRPSNCLIRSLTAMVVCFLDFIDSLHLLHKPYISANHLSEVRCNYSTWIVSWIFRI